MLVKNEIKSLLIIPLNIYSTYTRSDRTMKIITFTKIFDSYCRVKKKPDTCYNFYFKLLPEVQSSKFKTFNQFNLYYYIFKTVQ